MSKHFEGETKEGKPLATWPEIYKEAAKHKKFAIAVLTEAEYITERQRKWYRGICLPGLVKNDENGETIEWWDAEVKRECNGLSLLKKEIFMIEDAAGTRVGVGRLTIKGVGKRNMTNFIEEILSKSTAKGWDISPPNPDLRKST